jgi:hypothetical protein
MGNGTAKSGSDSVDQFIGAECTFSGGTPDVYPFGIQYKDVCIVSCKCGTQGIEAQGIIRRGKNRGVSGRVAQPVEARVNAVSVTVYTPAGKEMVEPVGKRDRAVNSANAAATAGRFISFLGT